MTQLSDPVPALIALLARHREEIAVRWAETMRQTPGTHYQNQSAEQLQALTLRGLNALIEWLATGSDGAIQAYAAEVSNIRVQHGFDIGEVIEALSLVRDTILPFLWEAFPAGSPEVPRAITQLDAGYRHMLGCLGHVYAERMHADLYEQQQRTAQMLRESESLRRVTSALLQKLSLKKVLEIVCTEAQHLTGALGGRVLLEEGRRLCVALSQGEAWPPLDLALTEDALASNRSGHDESMDMSGPPGVLGVPLRVKGSIIGALQVAHKPGGFAQEDVRIIRLFADQAAIAIENARLSHQEEQLAVMEERQRLARDLHDSVTQSIYSVTLYSGAALDALAAQQQDEAAGMLRELQATAQEALREMRFLIFELRPPALEKEGLIAALQARLDAVEARAGIKTELRVEGSQLLGLALEETLYWVAQEAINNVLKHARASRVVVYLQLTPDQVALEVKDNGSGFSTAAPKKGRIGLQSMRERVEQIGGELFIKSSPGQGTQVTVLAPLRASPIPGNGAAKAGR